MRSERHRKSFLDMLLLAIVQVLCFTLKSGVQWTVLAHTPVVFQWQLDSISQSDLPLYLHLVLSYLSKGSQKEDKVKHK